MSRRRPILLSWSGGKDGALSLHELRVRGEYEVAALVTTVTEETDRVSGHDVRRELVEQQARAIGLPLRVVPMPRDAPNEIYEARLATGIDDYRRNGVTRIAFGDLHLEDIRAYRERIAGAMGFRPLFPIWHRAPSELVDELLRLGFEAVIVCVDTRTLNASFVGRPLDAELLRDLPSGVDPCGENGELHTFVHAGPGFREPVPFSRGQVTSRPPFAFCDLLPARGVRTD